MATVDYTRELDDIIDIVISEQGSDIHLSLGAHPIIRVDGSLIPLVKKPILASRDIAGFASALLSKEQHDRYLTTREVDFSYAAKNGVRFRGNGFFQRGAMSIALRHIPNVIKTFSELALPPILESFTQSISLRLKTLLNSYTNQRSHLLINAKCVLILRTFIQVFTQHFAKMWTSLWWGRCADVRPLQRQ